jgi:hypothetical protein
MTKQETLNQIKVIKKVTESGLKSKEAASRILHEAGIKKAASNTQSAKKH